jgi:phenylpropionate dioxygenase-like ring-hydroxylating dioxygenase large terminal subunit
LAPASWYYLGSSRDLDRGPLRFKLPGRQISVGFRGPKGVPVVLGARCSHLGADLGLGCVKNGRIACPLHGWEYAADGRCEFIPATSEVPPFARQASYPVEERAGHLFFFNRSQALFPLPFYEGLSEAGLVSGGAFAFEVDAPWFWSAPTVSTFSTFAVRMTVPS